MTPDTPLRETLLRSRLTVAVIEVLRAAWPEPVDIRPSQLGEADEEGIDIAFVEIIKGLVDEGMVMLEAMLIGTGPEPIAHLAALTRKGATVMFYVTRPL